MGSWFTLYFYCFWDYLILNSTFPLKDQVIVLNSKKIVAYLMRKRGDTKLFVNGLFNPADIQETQGNRKYIAVSLFVYPIFLFDDSFS